MAQLNSIIRLKADDELAEFVQSINATSIHLCQAPCQFRRGLACAFKETAIDERGARERFRSVDNGD